LFLTKIGLTPYYRLYGDGGKEMSVFRLGDIVVRKSYGGDIFFKIIQIIKHSNGQDIYLLKGTNMRIVADSIGEDLMIPSLDKINENFEEDNRKINAKIKRIILQRKNMYRGAKILTMKTMFEEGKSIGKSGKVLHVDGDEEYLGVCLRGYKSLGIEAIGKYIEETRQPDMILELLKETKPDILVVTGHDGITKGIKNYRNLGNYRNSKYFVETVQIAREYQASYDNLVIFAGACQSHFEAIIKSGANFASSPYRVLIHAMDPVFICEKIAFSSITKFLTPQEILENTITGEKGIGGLQTRGSFREGTLKSPFA
jgi:spore coat assemly protein